METTKLFASAALHSPSSSSSSSSSSARKTFLKNSRPRKRNQVGIIAMAGGKPDENDCWGDVVDSNMIVLRKRIKDLRMEEGEIQPPQDWMEWEKKYYMSGYNEDVFEVMGILQNYLISCRPGLALGTLVLVVLSLILSSGMVLFHVVELVKSI